MSRRRYDGPPLDGTVQHLAERPYQPDGDGETVAATEEPAGDLETRNVPTPGPDRPDVEGQSTLADWVDTGGESL